MIDPFTIQAVKKIIKEKKEQLVEITSTGGVDNWPKYQYMVGQVKLCEQFEQELSNLINKQEQNDDTSRKQQRKQGSTK